MFIIVQCIMNGRHVFPFKECRSKGAGMGKGKEREKKKRKARNNDE